MKKYIVTTHLSWYNHHDAIVSKTITEEQLKKYRNILRIISKGIKETGWNWFNILPEKWDGYENKYVPDVYEIKRQFVENFGAEPSLDEILGFHRLFTQGGADRIEKIELFEVKPVKL